MSAVLGKHIPNDYSDYPHDSLTTLPTSPRLISNLFALLSCQWAKALQHDMESKDLLDSQLSIAYMDI